MVVEWGDLIQHVLPECRLTVHINKTLEDGRNLECSLPEELSYLMDKK